MRHLHQCILLSALGVLATGAAAQPAPPAPPATASPAPAAPPVANEARSAAANPAANPAAWPQAAPADRLQDQRGGADTVSNDATLKASVADNSARNVVTGNNIIDNGAFANMSGLPMVIQNSGANVLIQNATVINLQLR